MEVYQLDLDTWQWHKPAYIGQQPQCIEASSTPLLLSLALCNPKTSVTIQKCHLYTGNLNLETPGDRKTPNLHLGDVLGCW